MKVIEPFLVTPANPPTRASTATYADADGVLNYAAIDEVRPILETTAATNLVPSSEVFSVGLYGAVAASISPLAPDAVDNCTKFTADGSTNFHAVKSSQTANLVVGNTYASSIFVRKGTATRVQIHVVAEDYSSGGQVNLNLETGVVLGFVYPFTAVSVEAYTDSWWRVKIRHVATAKSGSPSLSKANIWVYLTDDTFNKTVASSDYFYVWGADIKAEASVSSYVPTAGSPVTRAADVLPSPVAGVTNLLSSNIAEDDYALWSGATAYVVGDRVLVSGYHDIYECIVDNTGVNPATDTTSKWLNIGANNRWQMFDGYFSTGSAEADEIVVNLRPGDVSSGIALFGVVGTSVRVMITNASSDVVHDEVYPVQTHLRKSTWYNYFFSEQVNPPMIITGLYIPTDHTVSIQITNAGSTAECTMCLIGKLSLFGNVKWGVRLGIQDYSQKSTDQFGNTSVVERAFADRVQYEIHLDTRDLYRIRRRFAAWRATPVVFIGHLLSPETIAYGYYNGFDIVMQYEKWSDCDLEVSSLT